MNASDKNQQNYFAYNPENLKLTHTHTENSCQAKIILLLFHSTTRRKVVVVLITACMRIVCRLLHKSLSCLYAWTNVWESVFACLWCGYLELITNHFYFFFFVSFFVQNKEYFSKINTGYKTFWNAHVNSLHVFSYIGIPGHALPSAHTSWMEEVKNDAVFTRLIWNKEANNLKNSFHYKYLFFYFLFFYTNPNFT